MSILQILVLAAAALIIRLFAEHTWRGWILLIFNVLAVFWLQPALSVRWLDFWLPVMTLSTAAMAWFLITPVAEKKLKINWTTGLCVLAVVLALALTRYLPENILTASRPPQLPVVLAGLLMIGMVYIVVSRPISKRVTIGYILLIVVALAILKQPDISLGVSRILRNLTHQDLGQATALDIRWLGYSYIVFRILHTLIDSLKGRLPGMNLQEYLIYTLFFPALPAGPIDRAEHFLKDYKRGGRVQTAQMERGARRIFTGMIKKFVLADSLAIFALNPVNAWQVHSAIWQWVIVYAYAIQIYLDFSGYTDIAIGMGQWMGVQLPENFNRPYLQKNITQFWNSWHISLTQWFRSYYFYPITRKMKTTPIKAYPTLILLLTQVTTMLLIALWHGVTWNFIAWGLWHGLGLFIQNRWSEIVNSIEGGWRERKVIQYFLKTFGVFLTFNFVALGWIWFALNDLGASWGVFLRLFGL